MVMLWYWDRLVPAWVPVGPIPDFDAYVPDTGGTITGPLPLVVEQPDEEPYAIEVGGELVAAYAETTMTGTLNMPITLTGQKADFGGAELKNVGTSAASDAIVSKQTVDGMRYQWDPFSPTFGSGWTDANYTMTSARKDREGLVMLQGLVQTTTSQSPGNGRWIFQLPVGWRPEYRYVFSTFCTVATASYARVDVHTDGTVHYIEGPSLGTGVLLSLDGISFYTD